MNPAEDLDSVRKTAKLRGNRPDDFPGSSCSRIAEGPNLEGGGPSRGATAGLPSSGWRDAVPRVRARTGGTCSVASTGRCLHFSVIQVTATTERGPPIVGQARGVPLLARPAVLGGTRSLASEQELEGRALSRSPEGVYIFL